MDRLTDRQTDRQTDEGHFSNPQTALQPGINNKEIKLQKTEKEDTIITNKDHKDTVQISSVSA